LQQHYFKNPGDASYLGMTSHEEYYHN